MKVKFTVEAGSYGTTFIHVVIINNQGKVTQFQETEAGTSWSKSIEIDGAVIQEKEWEADAKDAMRRRREANKPWPIDPNRDDVTSRQKGYYEGYYHD